MKLRDANQQVNEKKLFHTSSFMHFALIFSEYTQILLKVCEHNFFQEIEVESSNLPVQLRLT